MKYELFIITDSFSKYLNSKCTIVANLCSRGTFKKVYLLKEKKYIEIPTAHLRPYTQREKNLDLL